jgi:transcriptional regulator with XRE-family HTH domain
MTALEAAWFDVAALHAARDARRRYRGLTWRQVASELGIAASTITRMAQGGRTEGDGVMTMLDWLGVPAETFLRTTGSSSRPDLVTQLSNLLRARRELTSEAVTGLESIIRRACERLRTTTTGTRPAGGA